MPSKRQILDQLKRDASNAAVEALTRWASDSGDSGRMREEFVAVAD